MDDVRGLAQSFLLDGLRNEKNKSACTFSKKCLHNLERVLALPENGHVCKKEVLERTKAAIKREQWKACFPIAEREQAQRMK